MSLNYGTDGEVDSHASPSLQNRGLTMSKRSPSILVTDSRTSRYRMSAPFAGHAQSSKVRYTDALRGNRGAPTQPYMAPPVANPLRKKKSSFRDVSVDRILSDASDIPSGRREQRGSSSSWERFPVNERARPSSGYISRRIINPLPSRTSKVSQKLVLIPENVVEEPYSASGIDRRANHLEHLRQQAVGKGNNYSDHGEYNLPYSKQGLSRITAYNVSEGFNLQALSKFLAGTHEVSPRLYDECLYVAYTLPLLPGKDGFRIKSNISKKVVGGKTLIDKLIDTSEQRDHHYEYYSGVETMEDAQNAYDIETPVAQTTQGEEDVDGSNNTNANSNGGQDSFDPSEPQFFAEETPEEQMMRENEELKDFTTRPTKRIYHDEHAEIFIFHYGVIVFWNFTETQEKNLLGDIAFADIRNLVLRPLDEQDIETEEFRFEYDADTERPRIFNDIITLRSGDHIMKLTLSHAIAQSSKLSRFESRISPILTAVMKLPKRLALYGTLGLKRSQLLKKSGKLFKLRVDVNLSSSVLDTPDFFWSLEPSLHPLYMAMREYLEIDQRVQVLNDRCKVFLEFFDICVDSVAERNMVRVTRWFVLVILVGMVFSFVEIVVRHLIIRGKMAS